MTEVRVILCDDRGRGESVSAPGDRSVSWADWDEKLLALELQELNEADFDLSLTGFDPPGIDALLVAPGKYFE